MTSRPVALLALPDVQLLDVAGPLDVFAEANAQCGQEVYALAVVGTAPGPITTSSGRRLLPDLVAPNDASPPFDTLLVAGAPRMQEATVAPELLAWLRDAVGRCRRYGSVCSGAFLLGQAGLLDGRRVTTHWAVAEMLSARYAKVRVEADAICLFDGPLRTAAGVTAGLDLALALVEEDLGAEVARRVAAQLVMFFKRGGGQMQFRVETQSAPERDDGSQSESRGEVAGQLVVAGGDAAEVFEAAEHRLDSPAIAIAPLVEADLALAGAGAGDDHADALLTQVLAQPVGIVAVVGDEPAHATGRLVQHDRGGLPVTGIARREVDDARTTDHIGEEMDPGGRTRARRADRLFAGPPFPPWAARWALT